jgi:hypothetical protein
LSAGGWIKFEKELRSDPRVLRMAGILRELHGEIGNASVTLVLGGLAQIWFLCDTHIGQDDVLPLGIDDINQFIGVKGFAEILPQDWLQVIDAHHVKLPNYHVHNGTVAKKKALTQKRVTKHRLARNGSALQELKSCNAPALPDQDLDHIRKDTPLPPLTDLDMGAWRAWLAYRKSVGKTLKPASHGLAQIAMAKFGKNQMAVVNQSIAAGWTGLFDLKTNGSTAPVSIATAPISAEWAELVAAATAEGFRKPHNLERLQVYADELRRYRNRGAPKIDTTAITAKLAMR